MPDLIAQRIERLRQAQKDPREMALVALDFLIDVQPVAQCERIRVAMEAAAVVHWFNIPILAKLLGEQESNAAEIVAILNTFPMVERFAMRGFDSWNVHETTRLALRKRLSIDDPNRFRIFSERAVDALGNAGNEAIILVERLYHRFISSPEVAAEECENLFRNWANVARPEMQEALRAALEELEYAGMAQGRVRAAILLVIGWIRYSRNEASHLEDLSRNTLALARTGGQSSTLAQALCLAADVATARGNIRDVKEKLCEGLDIFKSIVRLNPSNLALQRDLAVAHTKYGDALQTQGQLSEALTSFHSSLAILTHLAQTDPDNASVQYHLSCAFRCIGSGLRTQGRLIDSLANFRQNKAIIDGLIRNEPENENFQLALAGSHTGTGATLHAQGRLRDALVCYQTACDIFTRFVDRDSTSTLWLYHLGCAYS